MTRFKVNSKGEKCLYKLCSLLIHQGNSIDSGHYYCYVRAPNNIWYLFNDTSVKKVDQSEVLKQSPYLLFYEKVIDRVKIKSSPRKQERISLSPRKDFNIEVRISRSCSRNNSDKNYKRNLTNTQAARSLRSKRTK